MNTTAFNEFVSKILYVFIVTTGLSARFNDLGKPEDLSNQLWAWGISTGKVIYVISFI